MVEIELTRRYRASEDIAVREIEGEIMIVPLAAGIDDTENELFTLNGTGKAIWGKLDGTRTLAEVVAELSPEYAADPSEVERGVLGLVGELLERKILVAT